jgi:hypothetical protein
MIVLNVVCDVCTKYACRVLYFQLNFENWTSNNNDIDKFIQNTQLSAHVDAKVALEWIPYDRFYNIKYIAKDRFGKIYKANWVDGYIDYWDDENQNWKRKDQNMHVTLKNLNCSDDIALELNKVI